MKNKIISLLKEPIIYVVIFCIFCQVIIYSTVDKYTLTGDSGTYLEFDENIFKGEVDQERTPVYPYFIKIIKFIGGEENYIRNVVIAQEVLFIVTIILFYYSIKQITNNKIILSIFTIIFGICPYIVLWNTTILTEPLALFEMALLVFFTLKYLKKPNKILAGSIGILIFIMIMTRPSYIYLLPIYILFWILRFIFNKEELKDNLTGIISCAICGVLILGYCGLMKINHNVFSITGISYVNTFITALDSKSYKYADNKEMVAAIDKAFEEENNTQNVWTIWEKIKDNYTEEEKKEFANSSIKNDPNYIKYLINKVFYVSTLDIGITYVEMQNSNSVYKSLGHVLLPINFAIVYVMIIIAVVYLVYNLIKNKEINWYVAFFTVLIVANIFTLIVGAPFEPERLFLCSVENVLLLIIYAICKFKGGKKSEKSIL